MTYQTCGNYSGPDLPYFPVESKSETIDKSANKADSSSEIEIQNEIENKNKNENENENETETGNGKSIHSLRTSDEVDSCEVLHEKEQNEGEEQGEEQGEEGEDKDKGGDSFSQIEESSRNSSRAKTVPKKLKKITKTGKMNKNQILSGYELEKKINSCGNDDLSLARLIDPIDPEYAGKIFGDSLEVDFIINFMKCLDRWCENEKVKIKKHENENDIICDDLSQNDFIRWSSDTAENTDNVHFVKYNFCCEKLLLWFEKISEISSFRILKLLFSNSQKEILLQILNKRKVNVRDSSEVAAAVEERRRKIRSLWQLEGN